MDKGMKVRLEDLVRTASHWLELFDLSFAQDNVPIHARPLQAAIWLVKDGIEELPYGDSKKDFFEKEWFAALVIVIREWYRERYGAMAFESSRDALSGLVLLHGTPIKLKVPSTITKVEVEGETTWLIFPDEIHESENWKSFFPTRPNFDMLSPESRFELENRVTTIVKITRSINLALQAAAELTDEAKQMAESVWRHVEKAVADILTLKPPLAAVGCWELHLAVEKAFKVFLRQNGNDVKGHNLTKLSMASANFGLEVTRSVLENLPNEHRAIKLRYGETDIEISEAVEHYNSALQLVYEITQKLRRDYSISNAGFLLKKPRWV